MVNVYSSTVSSVLQKANCIIVIYSSNLAVELHISIIACLNTLHLTFSTHLHPRVGHDGPTYKQTNK